MSFSDLFGTGEHLRNLGHFAAIVTLASADGPINELEEAQLKRLSLKLDIEKEDYIKVMKNPDNFPIHPNNSVEGRLERLHDLFRIIYADHNIDREEELLLRKYALGMGFSPAVAEGIINRSIEIFNRMSFEDYLYLLNKKD